MDAKLKIALVCLVTLLSDGCFGSNKTSGTGQTCDSNLGKDINSWFRQLSTLSSSIATECLNLPDADKIRAMENELKYVKKKCEDDSKQHTQYIKKVEMKVANISQEMKKFALRVEEKLKCPLFKKVENGLLKKNGDKCKLMCNLGTYALPKESFKCNDSDCFTNPNIRCLAAKSCKDILHHFPKSQNGVHTIFSKDGTSSYDVFCDMTLDGGGWTLAAVVANGDGNNWAFGDTDKDYGDSNALWENSATLGKVDSMTSTTAKDFKSRAFNDLAANQLLVSFKGKRYIQTDSSCLGGRSLKDLFNILRFSCGGSSYACYYGKCLGAGGRSLSTQCDHGCNVAYFNRLPGSSTEPLTNGKVPTKVMLKSGEAEGAQDGNKDRVYISTLPGRSNVDYVNGLGCFTSLSGDLRKVDISVFDDKAKGSSDKSLFYGVFVR